MNIKDLIKGQECQLLALSKNEHISNNTSALLEALANYTKTEINGTLYIMDNFHPYTITDKGDGMYTINCFGLVATLMAQRIYSLQAVKEE